LPGQSLLVYEPAHGLVRPVFPWEAGQAQERLRLGPVLDTGQTADRWMPDRHCCPCAFLRGLHTRGAGFIPRQQAGLPFTVLTSWQPAGRIETGQVAEQRVEVADAPGRAQLFRRRQGNRDQATRDGDRELSLLTNLPL
jgi:hypothetical protein